MCAFAVFFFAEYCTCTCLPGVYCIALVEENKVTWCVCEELVGHVSQRQDGDHTVVTISFNEVVASDGGWIDVVLPEWTNKRLQREREREREIDKTIISSTL